MQRVALHRHIALGKEEALPLEPEPIREDLVGCRFRAGARVVGRHECEGPPAGSFEPFLPGPAGSLVEVEGVAPDNRCAVERPELGIPPCQEASLALEVVCGVGLELALRVRVAESP